MDSNPIRNPTLGYINGYHPINISGTNYSWRDFSRSSELSGSIFDHSPGSDNGWYYSIGQKIKWVNKNILPGPYPPPSTGIPELYEVYLWIRVHDQKYL